MTAARPKPLSPRHWRRCRSTVPPLCWVPGCWPEVNQAGLDFYMAFSAMRLCIIFNKGVRNLQDHAHQDIRYSVIDLSLTPEFMKQALACTNG